MSGCKLSFIMTFNLHIINTLWHGEYWKGVSSLRFLGGVESWVHSRFAHKFCIRLGQAEHSHLWRARKEKKTGVAAHGYLHGFRCKDTFHFERPTTWGWLAHECRRSLEVHKLLFGLHNEWTRNGCSSQKGSRRKAWLDARCIHPASAPDGSSSLSLTAHDNCQLPSLLQPPRHGLTWYLPEKSF